MTRWEDHPGRGWIADFNEQGMEAEFWLIFQPASAAASRTGGWTREGMHILGPADVLTVWDDDGTVLFEGPLALRRAGWFGPEQLGPAAPHPFDPHTWLGWFRRRPALRAALVAAGS